VRKQAALLTGCVAGTEHVQRIRDLLYEVGFQEVEVEVKDHSEELISQWFPGSGAEKYVAFADIEAVKPL
jgi:hypothetical protein